METPTTPPLIVTAELATEAQAFFEAQRQRYFPPERNVIGAHVTLFHKLPGEEEHRIREVLRGAGQGLPLAVTVSGVRALGQGVAYALESVGLSQIRNELRDAFLPWLGAQDRQGWRPHVTVQNKVPVAVAQALHAELAATFQSWQTQVVALRLWRYQGGPWDAVARFTGG